ncbi:SRPBCC family protein [Sphaerimonospora thailandensis]|uniref:Polyketide cyclase/dehydrase/lipid transport protein n=1 Tax=Sphaerimonospora thailandensis TaxID=795644 RepID=A0A8J3RD52_9ACTN|nr:SRPBCC family protein [Sphaerimonospora thailandensis]GIH72420.1 hypothetical protein Mth01_46730 [Sphaerimonospora thailandensis]
MISGTHTVEIDTSPEALWDYLMEFDNWAQFVVGFQKFRIVDERTSVWTLRGDVGVLAREVDLEVVMLEQEPGRRATYSITGITERLEGTGTFEISPRGASGAQAASAARQAADAEPSTMERRKRQSWWRRLVRRWALATLRRQHGEYARAQRAESSASRSSGPAGSASAQTGAAVGLGAVFTFALEVTPGGPMAPMVEMLMRPLLAPSAEDFSTRIREQLEGTSHARD